MASTIPIPDPCLSNAPSGGSSLAEEVQQVREEKEKILRLLGKVEAKQERDAEVAALESELEKTSLELSRRINDNPNRVMQMHIRNQCLINELREVKQQLGRCNQERMYLLHQNQRMQEKARTLQEFEQKLEATARTIQEAKQKLLEIQGEKLKCNEWKTLRIDQING